MELKHYISVLARRKWIVALTTLAALILAAVVTLRMTPLYQATTTLRVATAAEGGIDYVYFATAYTDRLIKTYARVVTSEPLLKELRLALALERNPAVKVETSVDTELMQITVEDSSPAQAQRAANTLAQLLIQYVRATSMQTERDALDLLSQQVAKAELELNQARKQYEDLQARSPNDARALSAATDSIRIKEQTYTELLTLLERVRAAQSIRGSSVTVIEPAELPLRPSSPRLELNGSLGLLLGLIGGIGLAFLFENLDTTLHTTGAIREVVRISPLGLIPKRKSRRTAPFYEAFRHASNRLSLLEPDRPLGTMLITSAQPDEGKSTIAANLAYAIARTGRQVLLIDCALRLPSLHETFKLSQDKGLSSVLLSQTSLTEAIQTTEVPGLHVLTSGPRPQNPGALLADPLMKAVLEEAKRGYDAVLLDTAALLTVSDATPLLPAVDRIVLVVARGLAKEEPVRSVCELLANSRAKSVALIINYVESDDDYGYVQTR